MRLQTSTLFCLLIMYFLGATSACPPFCTCSLDTRGRKTVECKQGGMKGPLTLSNVDIKTEIIRISAPDDNANFLTMSPDIQNFKKLEELHITKSNVPILGQHFFFGLVKLEVLNLSQNNITQPLDHNFRGLVNLRELYLDDNRIYSLPSGTFRYAVQLRVLSLQRNRLKELMPRVFQQLVKLEVLKLNGNQLRELNQEVFKDIRDLRKLECRACGLQQLDFHVFDFIGELRYLDLGDNGLDSLSTDDFSNLWKLEVLKLDGNHLLTLQNDVFAKNGAISLVNLARNKLASISSSAFAGAVNLKELDLAYNKLEYLEEKTFSPFRKSLERLALNGNHLEMLALMKELSQFESLKELELANCGLAEMPVGLIPQNVNVVNLAGNYISMLVADSLPYSVWDLDLSKNRFRGLSEEVVQRIETMTRINLEGNPWSCDLCHIVPLLTRVNTSDAIYSIKCATPYHHENKLLGNLHKHQLGWCNAPSYTSSDANFFLNGDDDRLGIIAAGTTLALLSLTVAIVVIAVVYSRRHAAKYYTHEEKMESGDERESIFENQGQLFGEERELNFKFPLDAYSEKRISVATIDEIKKELPISNGT